MNNGMDDNVPDVCKICHHIISPEEDAPEEICEKCQSRDTLKKYNFRDEQGHLLENCEEYHRLLRTISYLLDDNAELRKQHERDQREIESRKRENMINCQIIAGMEPIVTASVQMYRFNEESRKVLSTAVSPTHKTILVRERTEQERQNYQDWEAAVRDWEAK